LWNVPSGNVLQNKKWIFVYWASFGNILLSKSWSFWWYLQLWYSVRILSKKICKYKIENTLLYNEQIGTTGAKTWKISANFYYLRIQHLLFSVVTYQMSHNIGVSNPIIHNHYIIHRTKNRGHIRWVHLMFKYTWHKTPSTQY